MDLSSNRKPYASVIGDPVAHSRSPEIFAFLARRTGRKLVYRRERVTPGGLPDFLTQLAKQPGRIGANVTLPHKSAVMPALHSISPQARQIGAVNVIRVKAGRLHGFNTDVEGIRRTLVMHGVKVKGRRILILGAGGAARAVACAVAAEGPKEIVVAARRLSQAQAICRSFRGARGRASAKNPATLWRAVKLGGPSCDAVAADLFVQTTPAGMKGGGLEGRSFLTRSARPGSVAFDLVYRPLDTLFLKEARSRGLIALDGLDMLVWQALATWELWFGKLGNVKRRTQLYRELREYLERK